MRRTRATHAAIPDFPHNFSAESDRERQSPTALRAVKEVAKSWGTGITPVQKSLSSDAALPSLYRRLGSVLIAKSPPRDTVPIPGRSSNAGISPAGVYSMSSRMTEAAMAGVWLVEEVEGVPENERWFASGGPLTAPYPHFSTQAEGEQWLREHGLPDFTVEYLGP